jgi:energy-coupling factor transporter ATP-binding protein EcfA2
VGPTGCGKSTFLRMLAQSEHIARAPRLIVDPMDSALTDLPGCVTFSDPGRMPSGGTVRYVPRDPWDMEGYGRVYSEARARILRREWPSVWIWCDEGGTVLPARGFSHAAGAVVVMGRKANVGHACASTRPVELMVSLKSNAAYLAVWPLPEPADIADIASRCAMTPTELEERFSLLPEHGFLWVWTGALPRVVVPCGPVE